MYIKENKDANIDITYLDHSKILDIANADITDLLLFGKIERISDDTEYDFENNQFMEQSKISFYISNFYVDIGEPIALIYSDYELQNERYGDWTTEYEIVFKMIKENWYLAYRNK